MAEQNKQRKPKEKEKKTPAVISLAFDNYRIENDKRYAVCGSCRKQLCDTEKSTGNFTRHLKKCNIALYNKYENSKISHEEIDLSKIPKTQENTTTMIAKCLLIMCNLPFSIVETKGFKLFLQYVDKKYDPVSRYTMKRRCMTINQELNDNINKYLEKARFISITVDIWSDRRLRYYLGVTGHFVDDNFEFKTVVLKCHYIQGEKTGENIYKTLNKILQERKIENKVVKIVCDNGANMIKACKVKLLESNRNKENDTDDSLDDSSDDDIDESEADLTNEMEKFLTLLVNNQNNNAAVRCFCHTLQLVVKKSLLEVKSLKKLFEKCKNVAKKSKMKTKFAEALCDKGHFIPTAVPTRWNSEYKLIQYISKIETDELNLILNISEVNIEFTETEHSSLNEVVEILEPFAYITDLLQGRSYCTISLVRPSIFELMHHLSSLKLRNSSLQKFVEALATGLKLRFSGAIQNITDPFNENNEKYSDYYFLMAAFLDPQFKLDWLCFEMTVDNQRRSYLFSKVKNLLWVEYARITEQFYESNEKLLNPSQNTNSQQASSDSTNTSSISVSASASQSSSSANCFSQSASSQSLPQESQSGANKKSTQNGNSSPAPKRKLFNYTRQNEKISKFNEEQIFKNEVEKYFDEPYDDELTVSQFWCTHKQVYARLNFLASKILSVPGSSSPIESVFSIAGNIMNEKRTKLSTQTLENMLNAKCNSHLINY